MPHSAATADGTGPTVVIVECATDLAAHLPAWEALAAEAMEPNIYYEPALLLPALEAFPPTLPMRFVLMYAGDPGRPKDPPRLYGFFPLERARSCRGLPVSCLRLWRHTHCFLCTPLLRPGHAAECLTALFEWAAADPRGAALLEMPLVPGDGAFHRLLVEEFHNRRRPTYVAECHTRAVLQPAADAETYLRGSVSGKGLNDLRRRRRRLAEAGELEVSEPPPGADPAPWLDRFLALEAAGWKGREGTALACRRADAGFFRTAATEAHRRGRFLLLEMRLDGRPVAVVCAFLSGDRAFTFKTAFDEAHAAFSPGQMVEVELVRRIHDCPGVRCMDSCTTPDNALINRLWSERRVIQTVVAATGRSPGGLAVSALPLVRRLKQGLFGVGPK